MKCNNCGEEIADITKFCGKCGTKVNVQKKPKGKLTASSIITIIAVVGFSSFLNSYNNSKSEAQSRDPQYIAQEVKKKMSLPAKVDEVTTLTDITAGTSSMRYHYMVEEGDYSSVSNSTFKNNLLPDICKSSKPILDNDITLEFSYKVKNSSQEFYFTVNKSECN